MASLLALQNPRLLTAEEFLAIDFGPELRAELDEGVIRMVASGSREHARSQANIVLALGSRLRGSGCRAYGPDMAVATHDRSVRYPDVTVDCGAAGDRESDTRLTAPQVIVEVLSPSTRDHDLRVKKEEYRALPSVDTILFVDPGEEWVIVSQRMESGWIDTAPARRDVALPSLAIVLPADETFARD